MSKTKKRDGSGYHLYYMCQAFASKGIKACKTNLIGKENIEKKVIQKVKELLSNMKIVEEVLAKIEKQKMVEESSIRKNLSLNKKSLEKKKAHLDKLNSDYFSGKIGAMIYNMHAESILNEITEIEERNRWIEREFEDLQTETMITNETIYKALENFDCLYETATNEQKKLLIRAIIKKIEVESNRKDIKNITFWFDFDDALLLSKTGGTVP